jgi:hypothetical protein
MIYYTEHAKDRMRQRGITEDEVEYGLQNYHTRYLDETGNPIYRTDLPNGKHIKIVVAGNKNETTIITVADY